MVLTDRSSIRLYPNPAKNRINVEISGFDPGFVQVQLLDNKGNLVSDNIRTVFSGNEIIVLMFLEKPGLYYLWLKQGEKNHKSKLIIQ